MLEDFDNLKQTYIQKYQCTASTGFTLDKICKRIIGSLKKVQTYHPIPNLREHFKTALEELRNNKELILCKAVKEDATVIMDVGLYTKLGWAHLNDKNTYIHLKEDPIVTSFNSYLQICLNTWVINLHTYNRLLLPPNTDTQTMYFLSKIHKHPTKVRPIVSCLGGPTQLASAYIDALLQPYMKGTESYIQNSTEVINIISDLELPITSLLATLDIESLCSNIMHARAIKAFTHRFSTQPQFIFLLDLLKFVIKNVFKFDSEIFIQTCGLAMGTKLAPTVATIVMGDLEEELLSLYAKNDLTGSDTSMMY